MLFLLHARLDYEHPRFAVGAPALIMNGAIVEDDGSRPTIGTSVVVPMGLGKLNCRRASDYRVLS